MGKVISFSKKSEEIKHKKKLNNITETLNNAIKENQNQKNKLKT